MTADEWIANVQEAQAVARELINDAEALMAGHLNTKTLCHLTGVNDDHLHWLVKHDVVLPSVRRGGRGVGRLYSIQDALAILALQEGLSIGLPLRVLTPMVRYIQSLSDDLDYAPPWVVSDGETANPERAGQTLETVAAGMELEAAEAAIMFVIRLGPLAEKLLARREALRDKTTSEARRLTEAVDKAIERGKASARQ